MALYLSRPKQRLLTNPSLIHLFSTSSPPNQNNSNDDSSDPSPISSYFNQVKASLKNRQGPAPKHTDFQEIRKNLEDFRRRSTVPPVDISKKSENVGLDSMKESLRQMKLKSAGEGGTTKFSLDNLKQSLKEKRPEVGDSGSKVNVVTPAFFSSVFGKQQKSERSSAMRTVFQKTYSHAELGEKLKKLRPQQTQGNWFSLQELNDRLIRLKQMEEKEKESGSGTGGVFKELRDSLQFLQTADDENKKKTSITTLNLLGHLGGTPNFMMHPPKEELVEKYFHPDNMSSAEKLKIELAKVREEFKMSDSDCGSARVQVAQLTTKIKHLASVLHKKDKHSKKGLQAMVQRRKKLLKYLRRTDWESYCFVLERLGLRDSPDYKN